MTMFWVLATLLALLCMALVVLPLASGHRGQAQDISDKESNVVYFREQIKELQVQVENGVMSGHEATELREELERKLLADVGGKQRETEFSPGNGGLRQGLVLALLIPALALPLYFKLGARTELDITRVLLSTEVTRQEVLGALEHWAKVRPDNPQASYMLGRQYLGEGRFGEAVQTFRHFYQISDGHSQAAEELAQALFLAEGSVITDEIRRLVASVLAVDAKSATALGLQGVDAFQKEDYRAAIHSWNLALGTELSPRVRENLASGIREARQLLGEPVPEVRVEVSLAPGLQALPADARVIVFARESGTANPPVAAIPLYVADLPREIVLDDRAAMRHGDGLGDLEELDLVARVSLTGDVSRPDYEGEVKSVRVDDSSVVQLRIMPQS